VPSLCLPDNPDLEHLKGQARTLQRQVRAGESAALATVEAFHPRPEAVDGPTGFRLADAQLVLARQYGFASWPALRRHLAVVEEFARSPHRAAVAADGEDDPAEHVLRLGNREVAQILLAAGATPTALDPVDEFLAACLAGDRTAVDGLLAERPALAREAIARRPDAILQATELRRADVVRLLAGLGFDVNAWARIAPLHQAAYDGDVTVVEALLELGADPDNRDPEYNSTPLGWAEHNRQQAVIELLRARTEPPA
jgi:ankyrin repeat protein